MTILLPFNVELDSGENTVDLNFPRNISQEIEKKKELNCPTFVFLNELSLKVHNNAKIVDYQYLYAKCPQINDIFLNPWFENKNENYFKQCPGKIFGILKQKSINEKIYFQFINQDKLILNFLEVEKFYPNTKLTMLFEYLDNNGEWKSLKEDHSVICTGTLSIKV